MKVNFDEYRFLKKISEFFSRRSLLIVSLPYLILSGIESDYNFQNILPFSLLIFLIINLILNKINIKFIEYLLTNAIFYTLYSLIIFRDTSYTFHSLSFTVFSLIFLILSLVIFYIIIFKSNSFKFFNVVMLTFCLLQIFTLKKSNSREEIFQNYATFKTDHRAVALLDIVGFSPLSICFILSFIIPLVNRSFSSSGK